MYLIRETSKIAGGIVVSMFSGGRFFHYQFNRNSAGGFTNPQGKTIGALPELVTYYKVCPPNAEAVCCFVVVVRSACSGVFLRRMRTMFTRVRFWQYNRDGMACTLGRAVQVT